VLASSKSNSSPRQINTPLRAPTFLLIAWLIGHQPAVLFSHNKQVTSNQPAVLFSQNKSAPAISHQPNEQALSSTGCPQLLRALQPVRLAYQPPASNTFLSEQISNTFLPEQSAPATSQTNRLLFCAQLQQQS
jgi:hypothetical protein